MSESRPARSPAAWVAAIAVAMASAALIAPLASSPSRSVVPPVPAPVPAPAAPPRARPPLETVVHGSGPWTVIVLHGYGASGEDLVPLADALALRAPARYVVAAAPTPMPDGVGRMWFPAGGASTPDEVEDARERVEALVDAEIARGTPEERVIVGGFSQGGILSIALALATRHHLGGIFVLSGRALPHASGAASRLVGLPVFQSHGRGDARIAFADGEAFATEARAAGADVTFVPFDGPHAIPPTIEAALGDWLRVRASSTVP